MIYFSSSRESEKPLIYRVAPEGGIIEAVTKVPDPYDGLEEWSGLRAVELPFS